MLSLQVPADFAFGSAVCSFGWFVLAPNVWDVTRQTLETAVTLNDERAAAVAVRQSSSKRLTVTLRGAVSADEKRAVRSVIRRMLRLDEQFAPFHSLCRKSSTHRPAATEKFGRLIRGATLFEDVIKVICTCNVTWRQTVSMVDRLVERWGVPSAVQGRNGFPTPANLAHASLRELKSHARVGYRAEFIQRFARDVHAGRLSLQFFEMFEGPSDELHKQLRTIHGVGDYAAGNLCMLLGRYDRLAVDTEMVRLLRQRFPRKKLTPTAIRKLYARWQPYQFLAYWYELWQDYVARHGRADQWSPAREGQGITSSFVTEESAAPQSRRGRAR